MVSYTVMIVPLRSNIDSLDGLRFFLWVKKLQVLERKKDVLWMSLQQPVWSRRGTGFRSKLQGNVKTGKIAEMMGVRMNSFHPDRVILDNTTPMVLEKLG